MIDQLQADVVRWHENRFPGARQEHVALKGCEEMGEVASAVLGMVGTSSASGKGDVPGEAADVLICLLVLIGRWYPNVSLDAEVRSKLAILCDPTSGHRSAALS